MKCPFRTKTILTKDIKKQYQFAYDRTEITYMDCVGKDCMAYNVATNLCRRLEGENNDKS